jgi:hypothetical protein
MPKAVNAVLFPTPEFMRMVGVPTDPAERMVSFVALAVKRDPPEKR